MRIGTVVLLLALVTAPACGGGGGSTDPGGSGGPLSASFIPDVTAPGANTVSMVQGSKSNDIVTVFVLLTETPGVFATAFEVVFDDTKAAYLGFGRGVALEQGGNAPNYTVDGTTNPGRVVIAVARTNGTGTSIVGSKVVISLQFRVKQAGTFPLTYQNGVVYDAQSTPQPIPGMSWFAGALQGV